MTKHNSLFVISLVGLAVSAAALILLIPSLFGTGEHADIWLVGGLAVLAVGFAVGTRHFGPPTTISGGR